MPQGSLSLLSGERTGYWDHSQGFSLQREMDLNQDSEVLLSASPNSPSRCKTERRGAQAPPPTPRAALSPSLPWTPGGLWGRLFLKEPKQAWQKLPMSLLFVVLSDASTCYITDVYNIYILSESPGWLLSTQFCWENWLHFLGSLSINLICCLCLHAWEPPRRSENLHS